MTQQQLAEAKELVQELSDRKKELKAAMFGNKLASFNALTTSMSEACLGELQFAHIQLPFDKVDFASTELKPVDIRVAYDFLLPLENGQHIVAFKRVFSSLEFDKCYTQMSCFDQLGRLTGTDVLQRHVQPEHVVECGPSEFVVYYYSILPTLSVFNSALKRLRKSRCKNFSSICCNSKFVFGLWDTSARNRESDPNICDQEAYSDDDNDDDENHLRQWILVHHLDTLSEVLRLRVPKKYRIERILVDEQHVVAMSRRDGEPESRQWFMNVFDFDGHLQCDKKAVNLTQPEGPIDLDRILVRFEEAFILGGWLVVPSDEEFFWFDKKATQSDTSTEWDTTSGLKRIYSSRSVLLFTFHDGNLLMKRLCHDGDNC